MGLNNRASGRFGSLARMMTTITGAIVTTVAVVSVVVVPVLMMIGTIIIGTIIWIINPSN